MNIPEKATHWDNWHQKFEAATPTNFNSGRFWPLSDDLTWLALKCDNWPGDHMRHIKRAGNHYALIPASGVGYNYNQWLTRRRELGLEQPDVTPEEDEAWQKLEAMQAEHEANPAAEPIDAVCEVLTPDQIDGYVRGKIVEILWRTDDSTEAFMEISDLLDRFVP